MQSRVDGQATPFNGSCRSILSAVAWRGELGLNVSWRPTVSTAVHWRADGQATLVRRLYAWWSIVVAVEWPGEDGLNATSFPTRSTATHWLVDGHATPSMN